MITTNQEPLDLSTLTPGDELTFCDQGGNSGHFLCVSQSPSGPHGILLDVTGALLDTDSSKYLIVQLIGSLPGLKSDVAFMAPFEPNKLTVGDESELLVLVFNGFANSDVVQVECSEYTVRAGVLE